MVLIYGTKFSAQLDVRPLRPSKQYYYPNSARGCVILFLKLDWFGFDISCHWQLPGQTRREQAFRRHLQG